MTSQSPTKEIEIRLIGGPQDGAIARSINPELTEIEVECPTRFDMNGNPSSVQTENDRLHVYRICQKRRNVAFYVGVEMMDW